MSWIVNLTPHTVDIAGFKHHPSGQVARVSATHEQVGWLVKPFGEDPGVPIYRTSYGEVTGLPAPEEGTIYLVSGMVADACRDRPDVFSPATGHKDVVRIGGQVASVPGVNCTPAYN